MHDLTEETLSSECLLSGNLLKVYRDEIRRPDGGTSEREWVKHNGASAIIPLFPDGKTLLVRQFRYPPQREFLELPAGKLDRTDEDPLEVGRRELEEETGWLAETLIPIGKSYPCIGYSNEVIHFYIARDLRESRQQLEEAEFLEVVEIPFSEALQRARRGELMDMKTVVGLLYAEEYVRGSDEDGFKNLLRPVAPL
jgi:ADP-ribose pyrophosphatase